jgi:hypothetical protein
LAVALQAQAAADPSGHWEGVIRADTMEITIEIDLARDAQGALAGRFSNLAQNVRGFPLSSVGVDGTAVTFAIAAAGGGVFRGSVGSDGQSIRGAFSTRGADSQPLELPFELTRTGAARIEAAPTSPAIGAQLEGAWSGTLEVEGTPRPLRLKLLNHADGTATGFLITGEGVEIAIARIEQQASSVTLDVSNIGGRYVGTLSGDGLELAGTWTQGPFTAPLVFRRSTVD